MTSQTRAGRLLWRIELLGELRAAHGDRVVTRFHHQKAAALLAYLAFSEAGGHPRAHPREELVELLWPEIDPDLGRGKPRFMLHSLRQQLEPPDAPTAPRLLIAERTTLRLDPAAFTTDVAEFQAALQTALRSEVPGERAQHLARAVALYRGDLLPGFFEPWALTERQHLAELYLSALQQLAAALERVGNLEGALAAAQKAVSLDPLREEAHYELTKQPRLLRRVHCEGKRMPHSGDQPACAVPEPVPPLLSGAQADIAPLRQRRRSLLQRCLGNGYVHYKGRGMGDQRQTRLCEEERPDSTPLTQSGSEGEHRWKRCENDWT